MEYAIHNEKGLVFSISSIEKVFEEADLGFFVDAYKLTKLFNLIQLDIKMLIDLGVISVEEDGHYPYDEIENSITTIGNHLRYKLGDDVVDNWDDTIIQGLKTEEIKKGGLLVLLRATSDSVKDVEMLFDLINMFKNLENKW